MSKVLVVAPHPDDETLGCGGTLLRHKYEEDELYWIIVTGIKEEFGWSTQSIKKRDTEIDTVAKRYGFRDVFNFSFPTIRIDTLPLSELIQQISYVYNKIEPELIYMPFAYDVHTDHQLIAKALQSTFKWFRHSHIRKVMMYETLSETEFNFIDKRAFSPNVFLDISKYLDDKIDIFKIYSSEIGEFPFPRSEKSLRSLAALRGSQSGYDAAEAFELVFEKR
jgi:LmbE family N-acetylglucosaminyl deacetylase